jgi:putative transposase
VVFSKSSVQLCIVYLVRNSVKFVSDKDRKAFCENLKQIYQSVTIEEAEQALEHFKQQWDERYPAIGKLWERQWKWVIPVFVR